MALTAAFGVKRLTCVHRPMPSSVCRAGSTAARTQWHAGMRNSCVFDTPVKSTRRDKVKAVLQRNVWEFFFICFCRPERCLSSAGWFWLGHAVGSVCVWAPCWPHRLPRHWTGWWWHGWSGRCPCFPSCPSETRWSPGSGGAPPF